MKKQFFTFLLMLLPVMVSADPVEIDGIYYNLVKKINEAEVTSKPNGGYSGDIIIPSSITHDGIAYNVTSVGVGAFSSSKSLVSVILPDGIKTIGSHAFWDCDGLLSITIPKSLISIGEGAFIYCYNLKEVFISDLDAWFNIDFESESSNPLFYQGGNDSQNHLYLNNEEVLDLVIPSKITEIKKYIFYGASSIKSVTFHKNVKSIGNSAFVLNSITSVHISDLSSWMNIDFADNSSNPFSNYYGNNPHKLYLNGEEIKDLVIPNDVTSIGDYVFIGCYGFSSVTIHSSVNSIGKNAFMGCHGLTTITIPNSVTNIGGGAFGYCINLKQMNIPNKLISIEDGVWSDCKSLEKIEIPTSITAIGKNSFGGCESITSILIPNSVVSIGNSAFYNCLNLETITIGSGIKTIGDQYGEYFTPGGYVFSNCPEIKDVYCLAESVPVTQLNTFSNSYIEHATLHVPAVSFDAYKNSAPWNGFKGIVSIGEDEIPETPKCATPEISFENGRVCFSCDTEGVEYITDIKLADEHKFYDSEIQLSQKYTVTVYAIKNGYDNSETVTRDIIIKGDGKAIIVGDVNNDGKVNVADHVELSKIIMNQ